VLKSIHLRHPVLGKQLGVLCFGCQSNLFQHQRLVVFVGRTSNSSSLILLFHSLVPVLTVVDLTRVSEETTAVYVTIERHSIFKEPGASTENHD